MNLIPMPHLAYLPFKVTLTTGVLTFGLLPTGIKKGHRFLSRFQFTDFFPGGLVAAHRVS